jgi:hypothetical protein
MPIVMPDICILLMKTPKNAVEWDEIPPDFGKPSNFSGVYIVLSTRLSYKR